jgi:Kip1 ubiquitination-promoting complex protein 1
MLIKQTINQEGVGDFLNSYAFDGKRVKKWHTLSSTYGEPWVVGDVIGCAMDLDAGGEFFCYVMW